MFVDHDPMIDRRGLVKHHRAGTRAGQPDRSDRARRSNLFNDPANCVRSVRPSLQAGKESQNGGAERLGLLPTDAVVGGDPIKGGQLET